MENEYYKKYEPFFGEWHIKRFLGAGSYGKVFEIERRDAFDTVYTGALKAITIPSSPSELDEILADGMGMEGASTYFRDYVKEINREIALMSKLKGHSNIVSYEDHKVFPHEDGVGWDILIRMELLTPITSYLKENHTFTRREIIRLGMDLCKALEICQRYNIIHRDIKPANIFLSETEDFKLGDFGVARIASASTGASTRAGTVNYMAPEVFRGEKYTSNVDIYSLGLVMYQLLNANRMPLYPPYPQPITLSSRERAQARRLSGAVLPAPANADGRLAEIVLKACAPDPAQRYESPAVMRQALEAILYTEGEARMIYPEGDAVAVPSTNSPAHPQPAEDQTVRVGIQPAALADDRTVRLMPDAAPAPVPAPAPADAPAADHTERIAEPTPVQNMQEDEKTALLFEAQAEKRRQEEQAKRDAEEAARRKAAEEKEAELARIRAEKRAAEEARRAAEEERKAAEKAELEQAAQRERKCREAEEVRKVEEQRGEKRSAEIAQKKKVLKGNKLLLVIGGIAIAVAVAVGGFVWRDNILGWAYYVTSVPFRSSSSSSKVVASGICGSRAKWALDDNGLLTIDGYGAMDDHPWTTEYKDQIKAVKIQRGVTRVSYAAFSDCSALSSVVIENGVKSIGEYAFMNCIALKTVTIPGSVKTIDHMAFGGCGALSSVTIENGVSKIENSAFWKCTSLQSIAFPDSVSYVGEAAFWGCDSLTAVTIKKGCKTELHAFPSATQINYYT